MKSIQNQKRGFKTYIHDCALINVEIGIQSFEVYYKKCCLFKLFNFYVWNDQIKYF